MGSTNLSKGKINIKVKQATTKLFDRNIKTTGNHINNALKGELDSSVVAKFATTDTDENLRINGFSFIRHEDATVNNEVLVYSSRIYNK